MHAKVLDHGTCKGLVNISHCYLFTFSFLPFFHWLDHQISKTSLKGLVICNAANFFLLCAFRYITFPTALLTVYT